MFVTFTFEHQEVTTQSPYENNLTKSVKYYNDQNSTFFVCIGFENFILVQIPYTKISLVP